MAQKPQHPQQDHRRRIESAKEPPRNGLKAETARELIKRRQRIGEKPFPTA